MRTHSACRASTSHESSSLYMCSFDHDEYMRTASMLFLTQGPLSGFSSVIYNSFAKKGLGGEKTVHIILMLNSRTSRRILCNGGGMISRTSDLLLRRRQRVCHPSSSLGALRFLNVHEYVSMELFESFGIKIPKCKVATTPEEAEDIFLNGLNKPGEPLKDVVVKAQVLTGGRRRGYFQNGLQGGVHMVSQPGQAKGLAEKMLGQILVTDQAPKGLPCHKVLLSERMYLTREMYVGILLDRASQGPLMVVSPSGGGPMEDVAKANPELIYTEPIDIMDGLQEDQCVRMASFLGLEQGSPAFQHAVDMMMKLYDMFSKCDCNLLEVNPFAQTIDGDIVACDAKVSFDDNAKYRQKAIFAKRDKSQEDPREAEASEYELDYVGLNGNIGCMVNGAAFCLATMDLIKLKGGSPANFLDVSGGGSEEQVQKALGILSTDPSVKAILVNIFGGIMRCDVIASGLINAVETTEIHKPMVVCVQGTNVSEARTLIEACPFKIILAENLEDAVEKVIAVAETREQADKINLDVKFEGFQI